MFLPSLSTLSQPLILLRLALACCLSQPELLRPSQYKLVWVRGESLARTLEEEPELAARLKDLVESTASSAGESLNLQELINRWLKGIEVTGR